MIVAVYVWVPERVFGCTVQEAAAERQRLAESQREAAEEAKRVSFFAFASLRHWVHVPVCQVKSRSLLGPRGQQQRKLRGKINLLFIVEQLRTCVSS